MATINLSIEINAVTTTTSYNLSPVFVGEQGERDKAMVNIFQEVQGAIIDATINRTV